jgi:DNA processing protein
MNNNTRILVAMNLQPGLGPKTMLRLLQYWPDLSDLLVALKQQSIEKKLPPALISALKQLDFAKADKELTWAQQPGCDILSITDSCYPEILRQIPVPPPILYIQGQIQALHGKNLAIVGSRHPSPYGQRITQLWAKQFVHHQMTLVSGLALGIDTLVHQMAVMAEQPTLAVLGSGLKQIYPKRNQGLAEQIQVKGAVMSEFSLFLPPNPGHFPRRNRIISGLSLCTLVIEAAEKSGTMITAAATIEQNRELFVLPGPVDSPLSVGGHRLIQQGAD